MAGNPRVLELLEEMLNTDRTAEEVCRDCPELLQDVRRRWSSFCRIDADIEALLPPSNSTLDANNVPFASCPAKLPEVPGYQVESILGHGGMGVVYRAWHLRLDRAVALKMILAGPCAHTEQRDRLLREAQVVAALHHPNIVQIYDVGEVNDQPYFTMEFVEGGSLAEKIQGVPQPPREAAALVATLAEAIYVAHQHGIVHRDLKPGNILLAADGTPKVTDFGLAWRLEGGAGLSLSGVPMGTPSYMSPCQARGDKSAMGPATDIWALGAILYDLLTGRPPFRSDTASATLHQVATEEPVPPHRLNPRVPRDLETICLMCLRKEPERRYATAAALADDLRRFERGEPIKARPVGLAERAARWVRRQPTLAGALAFGMLLTLAFIVTLVWWHGQRAALSATAVAYAEADLSESQRLLAGGELKASVEVLQRAKDRLDEYVPPELRDRLRIAFDNLELVTQLDAIRLERSLMQSGVSLQDALVFKYPSWTLKGIAPGRRYEEAFRSAGLGTLQDHPATTSARVLASPIRAALVVALDDWVACETDRDQLSWVLAVIRLADPDPWRDRFRDPSAWDDPEALRRLAADAPVAEQSAQLLAQLGARLRTKGIDAEDFLKRVVAAHPNDFWANVEAGNTLADSKPVEAIGYYRTAVALRPETVALHHVLGLLYFQQKRFDECLAHHQFAVRLAPDDDWSRTGLGATLVEMDRLDEAKIEYREAIRLVPSNPWPHHNLALLLQRLGEFDEAIKYHQEAARLFSDDRANLEKQMLRNLLLKLGRHAEACSLWKEQLAEKPSQHDAWFGYAELCLFLGDEAEYRRARRELLAQFGDTSDALVAERTGRACLLLPAAEDELQQAVALTERAAAGGQQGEEAANPHFLFAQGLARYRQGRFDDAIQLMTGEAKSVMGPSPQLVLALAQYQQGQKNEAAKTLAAAISAWDWSPSKAEHNGVWIAHILRREAEAMIQKDEPRPVQE